MYSYNQTESVINRIKKYKIQLTDPNYMKESTYKDFLKEVIEMVSNIIKLVCRIIQKITK